jgi:hypothetical protein
MIGKKSQLQLIGRHRLPEAEIRFFASDYARLLLKWRRKAASVGDLFQFAMSAAGA